jgi:hypothetical protein
MQRREHMSSTIEMNVNDLHKLAHMVSSIVRDLDMEVSGVRYDGGVIGFGYGQESRVIINRDKDVIAYDETCVENRELRSLIGIGAIHEVDVIPMEELDGR